MKHETKMKRKTKKLIEAIAGGSTHKALRDAGFSIRYIAARGGVKLMRSDIAKLGVDAAAEVAHARAKMKHKEIVRNRTEKNELDALIKEEAKLALCMLESFGVLRGKKEPSLPRRIINWIKGAL